MQAQIPLWKNGRERDPARQFWSQQAQVTAESVDCLA